MIDLINEILATLRHNKLRTALTGFAVSWGIFLLIVLLSVSRGLVNGMDSMFSRNDTQSISVQGGWAHKPYKGLSDDRRVQLKESDIQLLSNRNASTVTRISADISNDDAVISTGKDYISDGYKGVYPAGLRSDGSTLIQGRFINENDMAGKRRVIVISDKNVENLFGKASPIGKTVKMCDLAFTVIGVYSHQWTTKSYIPYTTARALSGGSDEVKHIIVGVDNVTTMEESQKAESDLYATLGERHKFAADDYSALWIWNRMSQHLSQATASNALDVAVWIISLLTMLSGIVGVSNIMFVSVRERTHEIGVRRAIGARPFAILKQIILESVAITTLFGYIGIVAGVAISRLISMVVEGGDNDFFKDPGVDIAVAIQVTVVLIIAGAMAGLFPALKSLKIKPVEALRDE